MIDIENAKKVFNEYVKNFNPEDGRIKLKIEHILRVANYSKQIATNLKLNEEQIQLATLIGLLHDIGRFKQYTEIGLGDNLEGFDHGDYGAKVLFEEGLIRKFIETNKYDEIIKKSIKKVETHNSHFFLIHYFLSSFITSFIAPKLERALVASKGINTLLASPSATFSKASSDFN